MKRGDVITISVSGEYGKPRPALVLQSDRYLPHTSILVAPISSDVIQSRHVRILLQPSEQNGLRQTSQIMMDKIIAVPMNKTGKRIGSLDARTMRQVNIVIPQLFGLEDEPNAAM